MGIAIRSWRCIASRPVPQPADVCWRIDPFNPGVRQRIEGRDVATLQADLSDPAQIPHVVDFALERFGRVDVLVNAAAIVSPRIADWRRARRRARRGHARHECDGAAAPGAGVGPTLLARTDQREPAVSIAASSTSRAPRVPISIPTSGRAAMAHPRQRSTCSPATWPRNSPPSVCAPTPWHLIPFRSA